MFDEDIEIQDLQTQKLLDAVCAGIEVPTEEEIEEALEQQQ